MKSWRRPALLVSRSGPAALCVIAALVTGAAELLGSDGAEQYCLLPLSLLLYSKLGREKILDNFLRGKIYGFILANPGESQNQMMARLDIPHGTLLYHLERLERERLVKSRPDGALKRYYPAGFDVPERVRDIFTNGQRTVYGLVDGSPGISRKAIAGILGVSTVAVNHHLDALLGKNAVRRERVGLGYRYYAVIGDCAGQVASDAPAAHPA